MNPRILNDRARIGTTDQNRDRQGATHTHHGRRWIAHGHLTLFAAVLWASVAFGQVYRPEVPIALVAHQGGPVPGIAGATFEYFAPPQIDAEGNVLLRALMSGPGIDSTNDVAIWFGQPGTLEVIAWEGDPAPDMPHGVVLADLSHLAVVSETGWITFTAGLAGEGITVGENDLVIYCGPPGDFQKVLQAGDPAPGLGPEVYVSASDSMGASLSDNATLSVGCGVTGRGLPRWNPRAYWVGPRDALQLALWEGMPAPGCEECEEGVILDWADTISHNDVGQVAFRGGLAGPGISPLNNTGRWLGSPGQLEILHREGQPMPEFGEGVTLKSGSGALYALNRHCDKTNQIRLQGPGITDANDWLQVAGQPDPMEVVAREGDPAPAAGPDVYLDYVGNSYINNRHQILCHVGFDGPNDCGLYFGPYAALELVLRDGDPAPYFEPGLVMQYVSHAGGLVAMNDVGDFVTGTDIGPPGEEEVTKALWLWHGIARQSVPLLQTGMEIDGRVVATNSHGDPGDYWTLTGGADGCPQSFNDRRQLAVQLDFTDGTRGIYRIGPPLLGDTDGDGVATLAEMATFAACMTGPGGEYGEGCAALDFDLDSDVDLADFRVLQALFRGSAP